MDRLKMYFLLNIVIFQLAMLVSRKSTVWNPSWKIGELSLAGSGAAGETTWRHLQMMETFALVRLLFPSEGSILPQKFARNPCLNWMNR